MEIGLFVAPQQGATYEDQLKAALLAERCGYVAFVRSDHYLAFSGDGLPGPTDSWVTLAALARETTSIRLGSMVSSATFRLPGLLAVAAAQVDAMSGGRVLFGLGTGWSEQEHRAYGISFPPLKERFDRLDEQLAIIKGLWTSPPGATFDFHGRYYQLEGCPALPKPVQRPHPPIVVGGNGPHRTPALAAAYADEYNLPPPIPSLAGAATIFDRVRAACETADRDPDTLSMSVTLTTICGSNAGDLNRRLTTSGQAGFADLVGTPAAVADQLRGYAQLGVRRAYLRLPNLHDLEHIELLGSQVIPLCQA